MPSMANAMGVNAYRFLLYLPSIEWYNVKMQERYLCSKQRWNIEA